MVFAKSSWHNLGAVSSAKPSILMLKLFCGKNKKKTHNFLRLTIVEFLLKFHPAGTFLNLRKCWTKKDSLASGPGATAGARAGLQNVMKPRFIDFN